MKNVSNNYLTAMYSSNVVKSTISGTIVTTDNTTYTITDADIIKDSLSVNSKCVNNQSFELGTVYQAELSVTLKMSISRYAILNGTISFTEHRVLTEQSTEDVEIGTFYISEVGIGKNMRYIKAVDSMDKLDIDLTADNLNGNIYALLTHTAQACNITLEQNETTINALPNAQLIFTVESSTVDTYRSLVAFIGMVTGTFAIINSSNKLELRKYSTSSNLTIPIAKRNNTVVEDYETYYRGITARFIANEKYATYSYNDTTISTGLILDLGDIPIFRGTSEQKTALLSTLFDYVKLIRYTPVSFTLLTSDFSLELGDKLTFSIDSETIVSYITNYTWRYHGSHDIKGVGDNPKLKVVDNVQKTLTSLQEDVSANNMQIHTYTNASTYTISNEYETIIKMGASTQEDTTALFMAMIPLDMNYDGYVMFRYKLDGATVENSEVVQHLTAKNHFVTLVNFFNLAGNQGYIVTVEAKTGYCESVERTQTAKITAIENYISTGTYAEVATNTTIPTATINNGTIRAAIFAQGFTNVELWNGEVQLEETVESTFNLSGLSFDTFTDTVTAVTAAAEVDESFNISVSSFNLSGLSLDAFTEVGGVDRRTTNATITTTTDNTTYNNSYVKTTDAQFALNTAYTYSSETDTIDSGSMSKVTIDTSAFSNVTSINVEVS